MTRERDDMLLDGKLGSARRARHWVMQEASAAGLSPDDVSLVELMAGELIANAIQHGPSGGAVTVETTYDPDHFRVLVSDQSASPPLLRHAPPDALGGRGIAIVDALATQWGTTRTGTTSKAVWFVLEARRPPIPEAGSNAHPTPRSVAEGRAQATAGSLVG